MKKTFTSTLLLATALAWLQCLPSSAQVVPFEGWTTPVTSTEDAPVYYAIMSSHRTDTQRQNRFLKWDGTALVTEQYNSGLNDDNVTSALLWRLQDNGNNNVVLVSCNDNSQVYIANEVTSGSNKYITMSSQGTDLKLVASTSTGVEGTTEGQYLLQDVRTGAYMNAMNYTADYHVTLWTGDQADCSGWFFYEFDYGSEENTKTVTVSSADDSMGSVAIEGESETTVVTDKGTGVVLTATAAEGYMFYRWIDATTEEVVSYRNPFTYSDTGDANFVAQFKVLDYPVMTRYYEVGLNQQNRYLSEVTYDTGNGASQVFSATSEEELPFIPYVTLHELQEEGAVIDKTATPIVFDERTESFDVTFKAYTGTILYTHPYGTSERTETCESELVWTRQALFIDWNNDFDFDDEGEVYESLGDATGSNNFGDADGSLENGWTRNISVPEGITPGTYRMRVVYMAPNPWSEDWPSKVFHDFYGELRNGVAYDFNIQVNESATKIVTATVNDYAMGIAKIDDETSVEVSKDEEVTLTATAAEGYMFYRWVDAATDEPLGYRNTYVYDGRNDITIEAQFKELDYPVMTRYYEVGLDQQNRYLKEVSFSAEGYGEVTMFTYSREDQLPFVPYVELHKVQEEGAVLDKTALPILIDEGTESFTMTFKAYTNVINYTHTTATGSEKTEVCESELVWTRQTLFVDWNNDFDFDDEGEIYESVGNSNGDNDFGDPNGSLENGWTREIAVPAGVKPGSYRMRVVYMAPNPWSEDWPSKVFHDFYGELRNGVAYDFNLQVNEVIPPSYELDYAVLGDGADLVTMTVETAEGEVETGAMLEQGTEYDVTITNLDTEKNIQVKMRVNGSNVSLAHEEGEATYTYAGTIEGETTIRAEVTDLTGISSTLAAEAYYDSETQTLYTGEAQSVTIYNVAGVRVANFNGIAAISMSEMPEGVYVAIIDGNELKFVR